jgi:hypothetical protein
MDCKKIMEIYDDSCKQSYEVSGIIVSTRVKIVVKNLQLQSDNNCLESIKMLDKYCKNSISETNKIKVNN